VSRYVISAQAQSDLDDIWEYISKDNLEAADRVRDALEKKMRELARLPGIGHPRPDVHPAYRFQRVYSYLIIYLPDTRPLQIVRVLHGRRDLRRILRKK